MFLAPAGIEEIGSRRPSHHSTFQFWIPVLVLLSNVLPRTSASETSLRAIPTSKSEIWEPLYDDVLHMLGNEPHSPVPDPSSTTFPNPWSVIGCAGVPPRTNAAGAYLPAANDNDVSRLSLLEAPPGSTRAVPRRFLRSRRCRRRRRRGPCRSRSAATEPRCQGSGSTSSRRPGSHGSCDSRSGAARGRARRPRRNGGPCLRARPRASRRAQPAPLPRGPS